jgi:hypothetical protein
MAALPSTAAAKLIPVVAANILVSPAHRSIIEVCQPQTPDRLEVADSAADRRLYRQPGVSGRLVTCVALVTLPNHYAKCPPMSDFSGDSGR